jgi:dTDP-4-dehydrorhamnose reductase
MNQVRTRLLVTGASGLLGLNLALQAGDAGYAVTGVVHDHPLCEAPFNVLCADLSQPGEIARVFSETQPQVVVHCAAIANLETAESDPALAQRVNAELPGQLAQETARRGVSLVHLSTDSVFDGDAGGYSEKDIPHPLNTYARTKLSGEGAVAEANPAAIIARVNFYGWSLLGKRSLAEWFFNNLTAHRPVKGFSDVYFSPLLVNDLADILLKMAAKGLSGIYHVASRESLSKYAFGIALARQFGLDENLISPHSVDESGLAARRSHNLTLNTAKLTRDLGMTLPAQPEGLRRFYQLYQQGYPARLHAYGG